MGDRLPREDPRPRPWTTLLLLADGRFPSGSHAYSAGMEQAVTWGDVSDLETAEAFVGGRLAVSAVLAAQVAAASHVVTGDLRGAEAGTALDELDAQVDARMASSAARSVSRQQGRRWTRAVRATWPTVGWPGGGKGRHAWVALGAAGQALGAAPEEVGCLALYELAGAPLWAAVRLMGLDPMQAGRVLARLLSNHEEACREAAGEAVGRTRAALGGTTPVGAEGASDRWSWISWSAAPLSELAPEFHVRREERLFAS